MPAVEPRRGVVARREERACQGSAARGGRLRGIGRFIATESTRWTAIAKAAGVEMD